MLLKQRPSFCSVEYYDVTGRKKNANLDVVKSRIFFHEYDHLEGLDLYKDQNLIDKIKIDYLTKDQINLANWIKEEKNKGFLL